MAKVQESAAGVHESDLKCSTPKSVPVTIAFACDHRFAAHTGTAIASLLLNAHPSRRYEIVILDGGLEIRDHKRLRSLERLHGNCSISFVSMERRLPYVVETWDRVEANYFRLLLPSVLSNQDRVLYLDSDVIVLSDVGPLFDLPLNGYAIAACEEPSMAYYLSAPEHMRDVFLEVDFKKYIFEHVEMQEQHAIHYFNSGVMLMDLKQLRDANYEARFLEFLISRKGYFHFADQDILNHFFQGAYLPLDLHWNLMTHLQLYKQHLSELQELAFNAARRDPSIVHFTWGGHKPWRSLDGPFGELYWEYLTYTPWHREIIENLLSENAPLRSLLNDKGRRIIARRLMKDKRRSRLDPKEFIRSFLSRLPLCYVFVRDFYKLGPAGYWKAIVSLQRKISSYEDFYMSRLFELLEKVTFIQIGALDGLKLDPLRSYLVEGNCKGILVEPVAELFDKLKQNKSAISDLYFENVAISDHDGETVFYTMKPGIKKIQPLWGGMPGSLRLDTILSHQTDIPNIEEFIEERVVPCMTFESLAKKYGFREVDLILINGEGHDYQILKQIDLEKHRPMLIIYEHVHLNKREMKAAKKYLKAGGYFVRTSEFNTLAVSARLESVEGLVLNLRRKWRRIRGKHAP